MRNSSKIRTMNDDLKDAENDLEKNNKQKQQAPEIKSQEQLKPISTETVSASLPVKPVQNIQPTTKEAVNPEPQNKQPSWFKKREKPEQEIQKIKQQEPQKQIKSISTETIQNIKPLNYVSQKPIIKATDNNGDTNLKDLLQKISNQTDKDPKTRKETTENAFSEKKDIATDNQPRETNDLNDLKNLINKISKPISERKEEVKQDTPETSHETIKKQKREIEEMKNTITNFPVKQQQADTQKHLATGKEILKTSEEKETEENFCPSKKHENTFWKNVSEQIKRTDTSEKINDLSNNQDSTKEKAIKEKTETIIQSGIIQNNKDKEKIENKEKQIKKKFYRNGDYTPPNERLIHGKQKFYSSVSKRIKLKGQQEDLEDLENLAKTKKDKKLITKEEEYRELKKGIIQKYHIKLFSLPWKKIIPISFLFIIIIVGSFYAIMSILPEKEKLEHKIEYPAGIELNEFINLEKKIIIEKENLKNNNTFLKREANNMFNTNKELNIIKLVIIDNDTEKNVLSLQDSLDTIGVINLEKNINYLPGKFLETTTNDYNLFILRTNDNSLRYSLALKTNNISYMFAIMTEWSEEKAKNRKMTNVLKPLFIDSKNFEDTFTPFSKANYKGIEIKYVSLIDNETALDYFIYKDILVFATSKDNAFLMIDLLTISEKS